MFSLRKCSVKVEPRSTFVRFCKLFIHCLFIYKCFTLIENKSEREKQSKFDFSVNR